MRGVPLLWSSLSASKDLFDFIPYETYCRSVPALFPLIFSVKEAQNQIKQINALPITVAEPGVQVYVDLRTRASCT